MRDDPLLADDENLEIDLKVGPHARGERHLFVRLGRPKFNASTGAVRVG